MLDPLLPDLRQAVIQEIVELTQEKYVYPDIGEKIAHQILEKLEQGGYDDLADANELALQLTSDLKAFSKDWHWSVIYDPRQAAAHIDPDEENDELKLARWLEKTRNGNFGFEKVERLKGNIGYIDLRQFAPSEYAGETAVAAMSFIAHCDALIFDIRKNHGGSPSMVQLLISYLVDPEPVHINTFYYRPTDDYQQFWTFPHVPGKRLVDIPVYVLISGDTGSGAEEFAYNLKNMERAILVGETTVGAAHPVTMEIVQKNFKVRVPYGRAINPITKDNWETTGVVPHIVVSQEEALRKAHILALEHLIETGQNEQQMHALEWDIEIVRSSYDPVIVDGTTLSRYVGRYGERNFSRQDESLIYMHGDHRGSWTLEPITDNYFRLDEDVKFEFVLDDQGTASAVVITYKDGRPKLEVTKSE